MQKCEEEVLPEITLNQHARKRSRSHDYTEMAREMSAKK